MTDPQKSQAHTPTADMDPAAPEAPHTPVRGSSRRSVLSASAVGAAVVAGFAVGKVSSRNPAEPTGGPKGELNGDRTEPFYGLHQAGVETPPQAHGLFVGLSLKEPMSGQKIAAMLRLLSDDAAALTQGQAPLADSETELAYRPARLTVTFGFGRKLVELAGAPVPGWLEPLPEYSIDRLDRQRSTGDLLLQICSDDPATVAHASRMLLKDASSFAVPNFARNAFRRAHGSDPAGTSVRNPFGQVDGTANPAPGSEDFARLVWGESRSEKSGDPLSFGPRGEPPTDLAADYPEWLRGGTSLVLRDIEMNMGTWDQLDRPAREFSVGRKLSNGAPLTGEQEDDFPDLAARNAMGLNVISPASHVARSLNVAEPAEQIFRRVYSYQETPDLDALSNGGAGRTGLMFASYQASIARQYVPIQDRLAQVDLLNEWTVPIGSTVWAIPPGAQAGGFVGQTLFG